MLRGLDGYFRYPPFEAANIAVFKLRRGAPAGLSPFSVVIARGRHLFPFRTEQLSPSAPMVLGPRGPGRVGRRRFIYTGRPHGRPVVVPAARLRRRYERGLRIAPMSALAIVLIVLGAIILIFLLGGFVIARRRADRPGWEEHIRRADQALKAARPADRAWDPELIHAMARSAIDRNHPGIEPLSLDLVLVDDRPGVE